MYREPNYKSIFKIQIREEWKGMMNYRFELFPVNRLEIKTHYHRARYRPINVIPLFPPCLSIRRKTHWWVRSRVCR